MNLIIAEAKKYGLSLNLTKCELISQNLVKLDINSPLKHFKKIAVADLTLLGAPVVGPAAVDISLNDKLKQFDKAILRLQHLHSHDAMMILRQSEHSKADLHLSHVQLHKPPSSDVI